MISLIDTDDKEIKPYLVNEHIGTNVRKIKQTGIRSK